MNVTELLTPWETINAALGLSAPVRDEAHYTELLAFVDECFERFGAIDKHPIFALVELVAERIVRFAGVVGRENVIAASDCGFATFAGSDEVHPSIVWAKFEALTQGARLASKQLWGR